MTQTTPAPRSKQPPPRTPREEFVYQLAMAKWMYEAGYYNLSDAHVLAAREAKDGIVRF